MIPWLARHRVAVTVFVASFCPVPIPDGYLPVGLSLIRLAPSLGFVGAGHSGVAGGGPHILLLLALVLFAWAAAFWAALTAVLRRGWNGDVAWWPPAN